MTVCVKHRNYIVWIDQDNISGDILTSMASAVENSFVVLMAINEHYYESRYCRLGTNSTYTLSTSNVLLCFF